MIWRLALLFTVVPLVETWLIIEVGSRVGPLTTVLMLLFSGLLGGWLARREGGAVIRQLMDDLTRGLPPGPHLVEGALVLLGATLLVTPGFSTDVVGMLFLFAPSRRWLAPRVLAWLVKRFDLRGVRVGPPPNATAPVDPDRPPDQRRSMFSHPLPPGQSDA
jgi:UPF0716 protein FxsA